MLLFSTWLVGLAKYFRTMDKIETTIGDDRGDDFETWRGCAEMSFWRCLSARLAGRGTTGMKMGIESRALGLCGREECIHWLVQVL